MKKLKQPIFNLDAEEQSLSDAIDRGEFKSVKNLEQEKKEFEKLLQIILRKKPK